MSKQLYIPQGANIELGLDVKGGITADSILIAGQPVGGQITVSPNTGLSGIGTSGSPLAGATATESIQGMMSAADKTKLDNIPTGGAIAPWFSTVAGFVQGLQSTFIAATFISDCTSLALECESSGSGGSGATVTVLTTEVGGVISTASGATANSYRIIRNKNGHTEPVVINLRTSKYAHAVRAKVVASPSTALLTMCALTDEIAGGPALGVNMATDSTNWSLGVSGGSFASTGVAFTIGSYVTLLIIADGTNIVAYLGAANGTGLTQIGTMAQSGVASNPAAVAVIAQNMTAGGNAQVNCDSILTLTERSA